MFAYLSKKLEMPSGANVRCLAWSAEDGYLACGCDNGLLKILRIETANQTSDGNLPKGLLSAPTNITMNQTLEGHSSTIQVLAWNNVHQKLTTSDNKGLIIVWMLYKGSWYEEMVNNRNRSTVRGLAWSFDGGKICIVYEDGGVIVGSADGNRLWGKDLKGPSMTGVTWSPDAKMLLFTFVSGDIQVYDCNGSQMLRFPLDKWNLRLGQDGGGSNAAGGNEPIVAVRWHSGKFSGDVDTPTLAVIWRQGYLSLLKSVHDEEPTTVPTGLVATCGDWSPNGFFIAIGGSPAAGRNSQDPVDVEQINIFSKLGKLLQQVKIPGSPCMSVAWDTLSLRLAIGSGPCIYFANLRPLYKFAHFGSNIFSYAFTRSDGTNNLAFWDMEKLSTQEIPGKIIEVKGDEEHCAILSVNNARIYTVTVLNAVGAPVDSLNVVSLEPFSLSLTSYVLVLLAENAVLIWKYQSARSHTILAQGTARRERMFHIDDAPSGFSESISDQEDVLSEQSSDISKRGTKDPAVCLDAVGSSLLIGRLSGKLQLYSLPNGSLVTIIEVAMETSVRPQRLWLNCDGSQMAMLDMQGCLSLCSLNTNTLRQQTSLRRYEKKDIWSVTWARDTPSLLCVMEKTRMYVMRNGEPEEPVLTSGYLAYFKDLEVTLVLMDELMQSPESPTCEHVLRVETRALRDTRNLIESGTDLNDVLRYVEENGHPCLWRLLAQAALNQLDLSVAETAFVRCKDYAGVQLTKRIGNITHDLVRRAEVASFFGDLDKAESLYLEADRKDLAADMWKLLNEWERVEKVSLPLAKGRSSSDRSVREMHLALGEEYAEKQQWTRAAHHFSKGDDIGRLVDAYLMLEDYAALDKLVGSLEPKSELLPRIGAAFEAVGLTHEAVKAYLAAGMGDKAVETAIILSQWNLAMELAQRHTLHNVSPVLLRYTAHLLRTGDIMQAVELLRKSDKPLAAGKLLGVMAIRELNNGESLRPQLVKQLFALSAMMFTYKTKRFFRDKGAMSAISSNSSHSEADLSFEQHIPEDFRPTSEEIKWMQETPWRGVEAAHFLLLTQRLIYQGQYGMATKAALHLRNFRDIIGDERVNCLLALAAANSKCFNVCSRAFIHLEVLDPEYTNIASDMYSDHAPKDIRVPKVDCYNCGLHIADNVSLCPNCDTHFATCMVTGRPIMEPDNVWTCDVCQHSCDTKELGNRRVCPLCHAERTTSLRRTQAK